MPRLPGVLEPAFPQLKRMHLGATRALGAGGRAISPALGERGLPTRATDSSRETARLEPEHARIHELAPPEVLCPRPPEDPGVAPWFFEQVTGLVNPGRFVLTLDDGQAVGTAVANLTASGMLDFETSRYFGARTWTEHPLFLRPRLPSVTRVRGTVVSLATRGTSGNYYHFLLDALPRWALFREAFPDLAPDHLLVNRTTSFQRQLLALSGLDRWPVVEPRKRAAVRADHLVIPSLPTFEDVVPPWVVDWVRQTFPPRRRDDLPRRLYVTRGVRPNTRRVECEPELVELLQRRGFHVIDPGALPVQDQIDHFAAADVVVGGHGAGLTNLVFAKPGVRVLELFAPDYLNPGYWSILGSIPGARYRYLTGREASRPRDRKELKAVYADIALPARDVVEALEELMA